MKRKKVKKKRRNSEEENARGSLNKSFMHTDLGYRTTNPINPNGAMSIIEVASCLCRAAEDESTKLLFSE